MALLGVNELRNLDAAATAAICIYSKFRGVR